MLGVELFTCAVEACAYLVVEGTEYTLQRLKMLCKLVDTRYYKDVFSRNSDTITEEAVCGTRSKTGYDRDGKPKGLVNHKIVNDSKLQQHSLSNHFFNILHPIGHVWLTQVIATVVLGQGTGRYMGWVERTCFARWGQLAVLILWHLCLKEPR